MKQLTAQRILLDRLGKAKKSNPAYSLRSFAKRLRMSPGAVSGFLSGRRVVTKKAAIRIAERLALDPYERAQILKYYTDLEEREDVIRESLQVKMDQFQAIAAWHHYALLNLIETQGFKPDFTWMSARLGVRESEVKAAIERLERLGYVEWQDSQLIRKTPALRTSEDIRDVTLQRSHMEGLELAKASLDKNDVTERDFSAITFCGSPEQMKEAKTAIRAFITKLAEGMESGQKTEVFRLNVQLFPVTQLQKSSVGDNV